MSSEIEIYEQELLGAFAAIEEKLSELRTISDPKNSSELIAANNGVISENLKKCDEVVKMMELEARASDTATKHAYLPKCKSYKEDIARHRAQQKDVNFQIERATLTGTGKSGEDRSRMLDTRQKASQQQEKIDRMIRMVSETEDVGNEITNELANNREKIVSSKEKVLQ